VQGPTDEPRGELRRFELDTSAHAAYGAHAEHRPALLDSLRACPDM
jgi:hypothetical protein